MVPHEVPVAKAVRAASTKMIAGTMRGSMWSDRVATRNPEVSRSEQMSEMDQARIRMTMARVMLLIPEPQAARPSPSVRIPWALEINNATKKISENIQGLDTVLSVGAAINTGEAMMGNMGVAGHRDSTVIGDVVNVAFRLESMTEKDTFDIIIGQESTRHIDNPEKYFAKQSFKIKGKAEEIEAYTSAFDQLSYFLTATAASAP